MSVENVFPFTIFNLFPLPIATVVVAHSPTPSAVNIMLLQMVMG